MNSTVKRYSKVILNLAIAGLILIAAIWVIPSILLYFMPFVIGGVIAWIANPPVHFLAEKLKIRRKAGSAIVIIGVIAAIMLLGYGLGVLLWDQAQGFLESLPELWKSFQKDLIDIGENFEVFLKRLPIEVQTGLYEFGKNLDIWLGSAVSGIGTPTVEAVGNLAKNIPGILVGVIMCVLSAYFFIAEKEGVLFFLRQHMPLGIQKKWMIVYGSLKTAVGGYFKAQFKIEFWIYLLLLVGLLFLKINYAPLIALGIAMLDVLPFFGTGAVMIPWAIVKLLSSDYQMALGLLIIWGVGQLVRQIIQPKIVGDTIGLAPIPTLVCLYIGYRVGSVIGMIIAVPIGIILIELNQEGIFDTTKNSFRLFVKSINEFRKLDAEDMSYLDEHKDKEKDKGKD